MDYRQYWDQIYKKSDELNSTIVSYWNHYSNMDNWQFWVVASLLVLPLILLYFTVDRKRIFELFFFGYTVHILWSYMDIALGRTGYFVHTYFLIPILPFATNMTASVLPVSFLLLYQYCTDRDKNFYMYTLALSGVFAFIFASIEEYFGLLDFRKGMNSFYLFLIDVGIAYLSYWFTRIILKFKDMNNRTNRIHNLKIFKQKAR